MVPEEVGVVKAYYHYMVPEDVGVVKVYYLYMVPEDVGVVKVYYLYMVPEDVGVVEVCEDTLRHHKVEGRGRGWVLEGGGRADARHGTRNRQDGVLKYNVGFTYPVVK